MTETGRSIDDYLKLPYTVEITRDEGENYSGWFARVVELPSCMTQADTLEELEFMLEDAKRAWITTALEDGETIPEPTGSQTYSGKFVVRVPKSLHRDLAEAAEREGVSLNTFVNTAPSRAIGAHLAAAESKRPYRTRKDDVP